MSIIVFLKKRKKKSAPFLFLFFFYIYIFLKCFRKDDYKIAMIDVINYSTDASIY